MVALLVSRPTALSSAVSLSTMSGARRLATLWTTIFFAAPAVAQTSPLPVSLSPAEVMQAAATIPLPAALEIVLISS